MAATVTQPALRCVRFIFFIFSQSVEVSARAGWVKTLLAQRGKQDLFFFSSPKHQPWASSPLRLSVSTKVSARSRTHAHEGTAARTPSDSASAQTYGKLIIYVQADGRKGPLAWWIRAVAQMCRTWSFDPPLLVVPFRKKGGGVGAQFRHSGGRERDGCQVGWRMVEVKWDPGGDGMWWEWGAERQPGLWKEVQSS